MTVVKRCVEQECNVRVLRVQDAQIDCWSLVVGADIMAVDLRMVPSFVC